MRILYKESKYNPNAIVKLAATVLASFMVLHPVRWEAYWGLAIFVSILYALNEEGKRAVKNMLFFAVLFFLPDLKGIDHLPAVLKIFISLILIVKMFYAPMMMGGFFATTSDVGSILASMDKLRLPNAISIPIAVMFRFFPAFREERRNIRLAMKIRGITPKTPMKYLEYVAVPALIISSNVSEDIAKAAETRCIESPLRKERYRKVGFGMIDFIFLFVVFGLAIGGWLW